MDTSTESSVRGHLRDEATAAADPGTSSSSLDAPLRSAAAFPADDNRLNVVEIEPTPPNGGYGWVCALAVFLVNGQTWGVNSSWAVIMAHYKLHDTEMRASAFAYALVGGLSISQALAITPLVSLGHRRLGLRPTMLLGLVLLFTSLLTSSFATRVWHLILSQGVCFGWGMGFLYIPASAVLPPWFSTRRSLAVGLATSGAGLWGLVYSFIANAAIESLGVRWAYRIIAAASLAMNALACVLLRETAAGAAAGAPGQQGRRGWRRVTREFGRVEVGLVVLWGLATEFGYITLLYSLPSFAGSIGLTPTQGSVANALFNLGLGLGRPVLGLLSDAVGRINMALATTALCALFCFSLWIPTHSFGVLLAFALLAGATCGTFWCAVTPVLVEVVGMAQFAATFGVILMALVLPTTFAEVVAIEVASATGGHGPDKYTGAQIFVGFMFLTGALSLWLLRCWKVWQLEVDRLSADERARSVATAPKYGLPWLKPRFLFRVWHV